MGVLQDYRLKYPQYKDLSDKELADGIYRKFYSDMPQAEFYKKIGLNQGQANDSWRGSFGGGILRGLRDIPDAGAQLLTRGVEAAGGVIDPLLGTNVEPWARQEREKVEDINKEAEREYQQEWRGGDAGFDWGRLTGNIAGSLPLAAAAPGLQAPSLAARTLAGAGAGAGLASVTAPVDPAAENFWKEKGRQAALGGVAGGVTTAAIGGLARAVSPKTRTAVNTLREAGVRPTIGQHIGGATRRLEEGAKSIPILGDVVRSAERRAMEDFNRGAFNRALAPLGKTLPKSTEIGRDALVKTNNIISQAYDDLVPKLTGKVDDDFLREMAELVSNAQGGMLPTRFDQLTNILRSQVARKIADNGTLTGRSAKEIESTLGRLARQYGRSVDADQQQLGAALRETQAILRRLFERSNPAYADRLKKINTAFAHLIRLENAAARQGSKGGVFSPAQLRAATRATDSSLRKGQFARGNALLQDYAEAGADVLGNTVPDSGTPFRIAAGLTGPALLGGMVNPYWAAGGAAAMLPYTGIGQRAASALLASRPAYAPAVVQGIRLMAPAAVSGAASAASR